jgi:hypothetical protein
MGYIYTYIYLFIGVFMPKEVSKQTPIKYTIKVVCVPVVNVTTNVFLIHSVFFMSRLLIIQKFKDKDHDI